MNKEEILDLQNKIQALINGINPFNGEVVKELNLESTDTIRLLFNIYNALDSQFKSHIRKTKAETFVFTKELEDKLVILDEYISLTTFLQNVKEANNGITISYGKFAEKLIEEDILQVDTQNLRTARKHPTEKAKEYEIIERPYINRYGKEGFAIVYNKKGQQLLVSLLKKYYSM